VVALVGRRIGAGVAGLINALDPDVVVIGGGVVAAGDLLMGPVRDECRARVLPHGREHARIEPARFADEAGMLGAALRARDGAAARATA
jgi:glucokinase